MNEPVFFYIHYPGGTFKNAAYHSKINLELQTKESGLKIILMFLNYEPANVVISQSDTQIVLALTLDTFESIFKMLRLSFIENKYIPNLFIEGRGSMTMARFTFAPIN